MSYPMRAPSSVALQLGRLSVSFGDMSRGAQLLGYPQGSPGLKGRPHIWYALGRTNR